MTFFIHRRHVLAAGLVLALSALGSAPLHAAEFSVTPIRADLKAGALSETITVGNDSAGPLRVGVKLMEWTQDEKGEDVYKDSADLVYFPRQLDIPAGARRVVRVGVRHLPTGAERSYRLFIEEIPQPIGSGAAVNLFFRFGVPVFVTPADAKPEFSVGELTIQKGKLTVPVSNTGTKNVRLAKVTFSNGLDFSREYAGWYSLPDTQRSYSTEVPQDVCRRSSRFTVKLEGEGVRVDRTVASTSASCG